MRGEKSATGCTRVTGLSGQQMAWTTVSKSWPHPLESNLVCLLWPLLRTIWSAKIWSAEIWTAFPRYLLLRTIWCAFSWSFDVNTLYKTEGRTADSWLGGHNSTSTWRVESKVAGLPDDSWWCIRTRLWLMQSQSKKIPPVSRQVSHLRRMHLIGWLEYQLL